MIRTFKILSLLLSYPTDAIQGAAPELKAVLDEEALLPARMRGRLDGLIDEVASRDLVDLQERYVQLFDRTRSLSLHLFEHVHGEGRDRGQAMIDLMELYENGGLHIEAKELPDYLPLFLEFLSTRPFGEAQALLSEALHIVAALGERLRKRRSPYAAVFRALEALAAGKPSAETLAALLDQPEDDPNDLEALDRTWEDAPVTFGPTSAGSVAPGGGCPAARASLARMDQGPATEAEERSMGHE
jgi:nitrate reductase molybdenum cofactor assembly chaperone NarJ/NarW